MLSSVHNRWPTLPILVLTMVRDPALILGMYKAGALGVLDKTASSQELMLAIEAVRYGQRYRGYARAELARGQGSAGSEVVMLSAREAEVVRLWAQGLTVSEIARRTGRGVTTISRQKGTAMIRLGLSTDAQLLDYARATGLFLP
jgi:two-component system capsular synthesis response regulator RcsB